jgi:hypothetical protein
MKRRVVRPFYPTVPLAAAEDPVLHESLALADPVRVVRAGAEATTWDEVSKRLAA